LKNAPSKYRKKDGPVLAEDLRKLSCIDSLTTFLQTGPCAHRFEDALRLRAQSLGPKLLKAADPRFFALLARGLVSEALADRLQADMSMVFAKCAAASPRSATSGGQINRLAAAFYERTASRDFYTLLAKELPKGSRSSGGDSSAVALQLGRYPISDDLCERLRNAFRATRDSLPQLLQAYAPLHAAALEFGDTQVFNGTPGGRGRGTVIYPTMADEFLPALEQRDFAGLRARLATINDRERSACIDAEALLEMATGEMIRAGDVCVGDEVRAGAGVAAVIGVAHGWAAAREMCFVGRVWVTSRHPVRIGGEWVEPGHIVPRVRRWGRVVNFVLARGHSLFVEGIECVTLGHEGQDSAAGAEVIGSTKWADREYSLAACTTTYRERGTCAVDLS